MIGVIILAAGNGTRYGKMKQFETVLGKQVLEHTIDIYEDLADEVVVVLPDHYANDKHKFVTGGKTRFESICKGFLALPSCNKIILADAVRCNTPKRMVLEIIEYLDSYNLVYPALPSIETQVSITPEYVEFHDKSIMYTLQTPTGVTHYTLGLILGSCSEDDGFSLAYLAWKKGVKCIKRIDGDSRNIKITYPEDLVIMEKIKEQQEYLNKLAADFKHIDDVIHENIMGPVPEKLKGLACRYQTVKEP